MRIHSIFIQFVYLTTVRGGFFVLFGLVWFLYIYACDMVVYKVAALCSYWLAFWRFIKATAQKH